MASGKGGTGKTTVSANIACVAAESGIKVTYVDCDVEEPNGHLFLRPSLPVRRSVCVPVPSVDADLCTACGTCADICQFSALICLNKEVLTFDKMCHGCGGCMHVCPVGAITERGREIGVVEEGRSGEVYFTHGRLNVGEAMSPPLIKAVLSAARKTPLVVVDVPPGTSCPVITAIKGADYVILVTEPTPFGINDLGLALDMVRELEIPHAVVVNRADPGNSLATDFCRKRGVGILAEIPDDRRVAEAYSRGDLAYAAVPGYRERFAELLNSVEKEARR